MEGPRLREVATVTLFPTGTAVLSDDGRFRYRLTRPAYPNGHGCLLFVMLNPSIADAEVPDPTLERCVGFARRESYESVELVNLFALRSKDPSLVKADPQAAIGDDNDQHIREAMRHAWRVVFAYGAFPWARRRAREVWDLLDGRRQLEARCLGRTRDGHPRHPLYLRGDTQFVPWMPP